MSAAFLLVVCYHFFDLNSGRKYFMNNPKQGTPWQRGKKSGQHWSKDEWQSKMAPWVGETLTQQVETEKAEKAEKKKRKRGSKGKKHKEWWAARMAHVWSLNSSHPKIAAHPKVDTAFDLQKDFIFVCVPLVGNNINFEFHT